MFTDTSFGSQFYRFLALGEDEVLGIEGNLGTVDDIGIRLLIQDGKILRRSSHNISIFQILQDIRSQFHHFMLMRGTEIYIIIDDSPSVLGMVEESRHLRTDDRIDSIIRAKHHNVIGLDVGIDKLQLVARVILIEDILRIVLFVQEYQRYR